MDSYHSTVMHRPEEEGEEGARRERDRINGASSSSNTYHAVGSPQTEFHHSPNGTHPRPQFPTPYHPTTPAAAALSMPTAAHISGPPASPRSLTAPSAYQGDFHPAPREKPKNSYYDPTSDSGPSESAGWSEGQNQTPQVNKILDAATGRSPFNC